MIAMVAGYAIGGGHVSASALRPDHRSRKRSIRPNWPKSRKLRRRLGRDVYGPCRRTQEGEGDLVSLSSDDAHQALEMGLVNRVVPIDQLEEETVQWAREINENSPIAIRFLKSAFNADTDGLAGIQELAGNATMLFYMTEEAKEGKQAFLEKRKPDFGKFKRLP